MCSNTAWYAMLVPPIFKGNLGYISDPENVFMTLGEAWSLQSRSHRWRLHNSGWGCQIDPFTWEVGKGGPFSEGSVTVLKTEAGPFPGTMAGSARVVPRVRQSICLSWFGWWPEGAVLPKGRHRGAKGANASFFFEKNIGQGYSLPTRNAPKCSKSCV